MGNNKLKPIKGKKFGKWTVISEDVKLLDDNPNTHWVCECDCGEVYDVALNNLMNGNSTQCIKCAAKERGLKKRKGIGDISKDMWIQITKHMKPNIDIDEAWNLFLEQDHKCALTGLPIEIHGYPYNREKTTAILCRKNLTEYYWLHKSVANLNPNEMTQKEFLEIINKIAEYKSLNEKK